MGDGGVVMWALIIAQFAETGHACVLRSGEWRDEGVVVCAPIIVQLGWDSFYGFTLG